MIKRHLLAGCVAALAVAPAMAADFPIKAPPPQLAAVYSWTGFYLGINAGGGQSGNCWGQNGYNIPVLSPTGKSTFIGISGVNGHSEGCSTSTGAVVGGQVGYRYQLNSFVFGIEAQGDWADLGSSFSSNQLSALNTALSVLARGNGSASLTNTSKTDAIGMFTGQVGYSFGPALWYVKGGVAVTDNKYSGVANATLGTASAGLTDAGSAVRFGEVVGTGLDYMLGSGWSIGAEYNHLFMGKQTVGLAYTGNTVNIPGFIAVPVAGIPSRSESISGDIDMATIRLNYRFPAR